VYPSIGNHDAAESEDCDDRTQVEDNFYLCERLAGEESGGRASFKPGLFYRFRYGSDIEFVCIDTSKESFFRGHRLFEFPKHWEFLDASLQSSDAAPIWRIPFGHHPPFSAGPRHHNTKEMARLLPLFARAGVKLVLSGHEHNFQHSRVEGIDYIVTGAGGKFRRRDDAARNCRVRARICRPGGYSPAHAGRRRAVGTDRGPTGLIARFVVAWRLEGLHVHGRGDGAAEPRTSTQINHFDV
jgi:hypothetical protein